MSLQAVWTRNVAAPEAGKPPFGAATTSRPREEVAVGGEGRTTRTRRMAELQWKDFRMMIISVLVNRIQTVMRKLTESPVCAAAIAVVVVTAEAPGQV